jgi:hypothetical protein
LLLLALSHTHTHTHRQNAYRRINEHVHPSQPRKPVTSVRSFHSHMRIFSIRYKKSNLIIGINCRAARETNQISRALGSLAKNDNDNQYTLFANLSHLLVLFLLFLLHFYSIWLLLALAQETRTHCAYLTISFLLELLLLLLLERDALHMHKINLMTPAGCAASISKRASAV